MELGSELGVERVEGEMAVSQGGESPADRHLIGIIVSWIGIAWVISVEMISNDVGPNGNQSMTARSGQQLVEQIHQVR